MRPGTSVAKLGLRGFALVYLGLIVVAPIGLVAYRTLFEGASAAWAALTDPNTLHAFEVTLIAVGIAVPLNTVFGVLCGLAIVRRRFPGKGVVNAFVDLPLALSPVVVGVALFALYGRGGWFGPFLSTHHIQVLFALPAIVLATIFVSVPFVAREVIPTLRELGDDQEQAAHTLGASEWQTFWRVTLPSIRWAIIYGVVVTAARCLGEYGSIAVVSGSIEGKTETAALRVDDYYQNFSLPGAYAVAIVLGLMSIVILVAMSLIRPREHTA
jgi:sulfate transport system permease protein